MRKRWLILCVVLCVCALLAGAWLALLAMRKPWILPVPGVRLEPARTLAWRSRMAPDSAFALLAEAVEHPALPRDIRRELLEEACGGPWSAALHTNVVALLRPAEPALAPARRAALAPDPQMPRQSWAEKALSYTDSRHLLQALELSALRKAETGQFAESYAELRALLGCAAIFTRGGCLRDHAIAIGGWYMACAAVRRAAMADTNPGEHTCRMRDFLLDYEAASEPWSETMRWECKFALDSVGPVFAGGARGFRDRREAFFFGLGRLLGSTPSSVRASYKALYSHLIDAADKPYSRAWYDTLKARLRCGPVALLSSQDPAGRMLAATQMSLFQRVHLRWVAHRTDLRATAVFLAIRLYQSREGRPPSSLDALVPAYIDAVPGNPFNESIPLDYRLGTNGSWRVWKFPPQPLGE